MRGSRRVRGSVTAPLIAAGAKPTEPAAPQRLPGWWLFFIALFMFPTQLTWAILTQVLFPADCAALVGPAQKGAMLGLANSIGSILQFGQIPIGAISDRTTTRRCGGLLGRRRPYVLLGQAIVCLSLVIMHPAVAKTYSVLAAGYATFMLGNALVWAPYFVVTADVVPPAQRGVAAGWQQLIYFLSALLASGLGFLVGQKTLSNGSCYLILLVINLAGFLVAFPALGRGPGCLVPEPDPPPPLERGADEAAANPDHRWMVQGHARKGAGQGRRRGLAHFFSAFLVRTTPCIL